MDYQPVLAKSIQDLASGWHLCTFDNILTVGIFCVERYGNIKHFYVFIRIATQELEKMKLENKTVS